MQETILQIISNATVAVVFCKRMETLQPIVAKSRKIFWGTKDILPEFPQTCPKKLICSKLPPYKFSVAICYSSTLTNSKKHEDLSLRSKIFFLEKKSG